MVIAIYLVVNVFVLGVVTVLVSSPGCAREQFCSSGDQTWKPGCTTPASGQFRGHRLAGTFKPQHGLYMARIQLDIRVDDTCETVAVESLDQWLYPLAETPFDTDRDDELEDDAEAEAAHVVFNLQTDAPSPVPVVPRVSGMYRLLASPVFTNREDDPMYAGDVIETELLSDGTHRVV